MSREYLPQPDGKPALVRQFRVPDVCTARWTDEDWKRFEPEWREQPDSMQTSWGEAKWEGEVDDAGMKLYKISV